MPSMSVALKYEECLIGDEILATLTTDCTDATIEQPVLIVASHPDDDVLAIGGCSARMSDVWILYLTDGSPQNGRAASRLGMMPSEYATLRKDEAAGALQILNIPFSKSKWLNIKDGELVSNLSTAITCMNSFIRDVQPAAVFVHPFEGGHPDHDAASLAAAVATSNKSIPLLEYTSYHDHDGSRCLKTGSFLLDRTPIYYKRLSKSEQQIKTAALDAHRSQQRVLSQFPTDGEAFRRYPGYDYCSFPVPWPPLYEAYLGETFPSWKRAALSQLANCRA